MVVRCDIAIVGGGLNGAALAVALKDTGYRVALLEPAPPPIPEDAWDSRIYAISPGNRDWIESLGGWDGALCRAQPVHAMRIRGDGGGRLEFDALQAGLPELAWIVENGRLQLSLWRALPPDIHCIAERPRAVVWGARGHSLLLPEGRELRADLLVAADGAHSWLRQQAGIAVYEVDYRHTAVVANFETERPHRGTAFQWFGRDGILAWLPLPGNRISIVWSSPVDLAPARTALDPVTFARQVAEAGGHALGGLRRITPQAAFPLRRRRAAEWVRPGLVLLGDAAHTVHPLAGQGVNLGFRDGHLLAAMLASGGNPGEVGRLKAYAARRVEDVASMQAVTGGLKRLFDRSNPWLAWLRNTGLNLTDGRDWIKQALLLHAIQ